jgi:hypothetical protein
MGNAWIASGNENFHGVTPSWWEKQKKSPVSMRKQGFGETGRATKSRQGAISGGRENVKGFVRQGRVQSDAVRLCGCAAVRLCGCAAKGKYPHCGYLPFAVFVCVVMPCRLLLTSEARDDTANILFMHELSTTAPSNRWQRAHKS